MILSDVDIKKALKGKHLIISPSPQETDIDTTTIDLKIGDRFLRWDDELVGQAGVKVTLDLDHFKYKNFSGPYLKDVKAEPNGQFRIDPGIFYLAPTHETVTLPIKSKLAARVEGKSSLARLGLVVHMTAPTIQCGFNGVVTLEIFNYGPFPILVTPGRTRLCQLILERVSCIPEKGRAGKTFVDQRSPRG
jgi:dCTP deaminase